MYKPAGTSQVLPVLPPTHTHEKDEPSALQLPPNKHGLGEQGVGGTMKKVLKNMYIIFSTQLGIACT